MEPDNRSPRPVAITGMAVLNAGSTTLEGFATQLIKGRSTIRHSPDAVAQVAPVGSWLDDFTLEDWAEQHVPDAVSARRLRRAAGRSARPAQTGACVAMAAVRDARLTAAELDQAAVLVAGNNLALDYHASAVRNFAAGTGRLRPSHIIAHADVDVIGAVSEVIGAHGEGCTIGGATASGTLAVIHGSRLINAGVTRRCVVVAPVCALGLAELSAYRASGALAPALDDGPPERACRPFDMTREGFVYAQAAAAMVLEDPAAARKRGVDGYALLVGSGQRLDGRRGSEPSPQGLAAAIGSALRHGRLQPDDIDYVSAHATGSRAGDAAESTALESVFGHVEPGPWINSTKALTGHSMTSSGLHELVAAVLQARHGFCHPQPQLDHPLTSALRLVGRTEEAVRIRAFVKSSLAMCGINSALALMVSED